MQNNLFTILTTSLVLSFYIMACTTKKQNNAIVDDAIMVKTQAVDFINYSAAMEYSGKIESNSETNLSFKIGGIISKIYVKEGDHVSRGQLLATLDLTEINAQVQQAKQNEEKASRELGRTKNLFEDTAATLQRYQDAQTQQKVALEGLHIVTFNQQYAQIRAADNGTIIKKVMNKGELASSGSTVLMMNATSNEDWVVRFGVSDKDWTLLKKGNEALVKIDAYPNETFKGIINKIAGAADPLSGTYEIEVKVLPNHKKFASGLFATIQLSTISTTKVKVIPVEAFTEGNGKSGYVYILNKDKKTVTKLKVAIAFVDNNKIGIRSGLENVGEVITDGVSYLTGNSTVKIVP